MRLWVGQSGQSGDLARYARGLDLLEVRVDAGRAPKTSRLARMRAQVPEGFVFVVVASAPVSALAPSDAELEETLRVSEALGARFLLLRTPPTITPTTRRRGQLRDLVARIGQRATVAWEPSGVWEDDDAEALASELGVCLVRDLTQSDAPAGEVVYTRLRALGHGGRVSAGAVDRVIDRLESATEVLVVVEGKSAPSVARELRAALSDGEGFDHGLDDDDDLDDEDEEQDDEADGDEVER